MNEKSQDLEQVSHQEAFSLGQEIGKEIGAIGDEAAVKINEILDQHGLRAKIYIQFSPKE